MPQIVSLNNTVININEVKAITVSGYTLGRVPTNVVVFHLKTRKEYIFNPNTQEWDLEIFNETVEIEFSDYRTAIGNLKEIMEEWEAVLELNELIH